ncbi:hypothetical protein [Chromobacterium sphagni]|uniref:Transmembrane protein n=1 Tax=Chromobacterium sphagni TaxID=1903179 RepID=A0ABX3C9D0_9NEIS|nr:hypothetical protein [Chromobacterium sphagni]OHX18892.1 hypothetical protein BI344_19770 [Chromobacterium sphagni]
MQAAPIGRPTVWQRLLRSASWPLVLLLAAIIVFEEYAWDELAAVLERLAKWPPLAALERWVASRSPRVALALFLLPALALLPVKLSALFLIEQGHALLGVGVILLAKLGGTALVARLFTLTRPALMQVDWFVRLHARFNACRTWVFERLRSSLPWRWARHAVWRMRQWRRQPSAFSRLARRLVSRWSRARRSPQSGESKGGVE